MDIHKSAIKSAIGLALAILLAAVFQCGGNATPTQTQAPAATKPAADQAGFPVQVELIPGKLRARVYLHDIQSRDGPVHCWSYVSHGLWAQKQKELIFTLRRDPKEKPEDYPRTILDFFEVVYNLAEAGKFVDVGGYTEFGPMKFLGRSDFKGIAYLPPQHFKEIEAPAPLLAAIALTTDELEALKSFGSTRVIALLGRNYRYYPYPPWTDRARPRVLSMKEMEKDSILYRVPRMHFRWGTVRKEENQIVLKLWPEAREKLREVFERASPKTPVALLVAPDSEATACLVWEPGQTSPNAIAGPDLDQSRLTGGFVVFLPDQEEDKGGLLEDGFKVSLTQASWKAVREAWTSGRPLSVPATKGEGMGFAVEWAATAYRNPVDANVHVSDEWKTYKPQGPPAHEPKGPVRLAQIVLLTAEREIGQRIAVEALSSFIAAIQKAVEDEYVPLPRQPGKDLIVDCQIQPGKKSKFEILAQTGPDQEALQRLVDDRLANLPVPEVKGGPVRFQVFFTIWGGAGTLPGPETPP